ncbi:DNA repair family protein [Teratosphaeria destructans]|uniref:DNA repair family protein n=1 Tax=Teratosphaeria destructans TaxID=418781 RepID=A0A9W7T062_9PEZI|nr:DNA repair family protein [Teratosphaeria destructans]
MSKRPSTLDAFISRPATKRSRIEKTDEIGVLTTTGNLTSGDKSTTEESDKVSSHHTYPFALPHLPPDIHHILNFAPAAEGRIIDDQPDLDLLYYQPYVPKDIQRELFEFLRRELFFYRVKYMIKRGSVETPINTPRFTTVFGLDETSRFGPDDQQVVDAKTGEPVPRDAYKCEPRPIPQCLDHLRTLTEGATGERFNFCLVNYYATGNDSISYHSDDERFLGNLPAIASFTLGAKRDFLLKHKPTPDNHPSETKPMKLPLASGDMVLMRGLTQSRWLHSIPKRKGGDADRGRINITFRRAMVRGGTENYYRYNVGDGGVYKWDEGRREMLLRH